MEAISEERRKEMEEEMNRFEQEIALPGAPPLPPLTPSAASKAVITAHTFSKVEDQLQKRQASHDGPIEVSSPSVTSKMPIPPLHPPPPPPSIGDEPEEPSSVQFIPHQVQRSSRGRSAMHSFPMGHRCPPPPMPPPSLMPGPMHGPMSGPMQGPPMGPPMGPPGPMPMPMAMGMGGPPGYIPQPMPPMAQPFMPPMPPPMYQHSPQPPQSIPMGQMSQRDNEKSSVPAPAVYAAPPMKSQMSDEGQIPEEQSFQPNGQVVPPPISTIMPTVTVVQKDKPHGKIMVESIVPETEMPMQIGTEVAAPKKKEKKKKIVRTAGGNIWEDNSLLEWDSDDFRIFCGDLGNDVTDEVLTRAFSKYASFIKAKVVRDKRNNKTKGFGFVSFKDPQDFIKAMREMNGKYVGSRPIKLRKSTWKDRNIEIVKKKMKEKEKLGLL